MRLAPWLFAALIVFGAWRLYSSRDIERGEGVLAPGAPQQETLDGGAPVEIGEFTLRPRAGFSATVRILRREEYSLGELASLVPTDFAVGWGPMSDSAVLSQIEISQSNRFYFWRTESWPIDREVIETHSANWHVIAENATVRASLEKLRAGNVVQFVGQLVDVEGRDGGMTTSLSRSDTGAGACEIVLATAAILVEPR